MIIIPFVKPKYRRGGTLRAQNSRYRYGGYGIWSTIGRKIFSGDSMGKFINSVSKEKIAQKVGDAVLSGASSSLTKATEKSLDKLININNNNSGKGKKFKITQSLIDKLPTATAGEGIVYD